MNKTKCSGVKIEEQKIENIQKASLKVLLQEMYIDYETAMGITGVQNCVLGANLVVYLLQKKI